MRARGFFRLLLLLLLVAGPLPGCGREAIDYQAKFDHMVDNDWKQNWNWVDAEKFFQQGGLFIDTGEPEDPALDRPHILPLLKTMREQHGLKWQAVVHRKKTRFAVALVAELPTASEVDQIQKLLEQEQERFPGEILWQFGHRWMSIDFMTEEDLEWERQAELKSQKS